MTTEGRSTNNESVDYEVGTVRVDEVIGDNGNAAGGATRSKAT